MEYIYSSTGILRTETIYGDPFLGMDGLIVLFFALAALSVGSFLNVLIYRLPLILQSKWKNEANLILRFKPTPQKKEINLLEVMIVKITQPLKKSSRLFHVKHVVFFLLTLGLYLKT